MLKPFYNPIVKKYKASNQLTIIIKQLINFAAKANKIKYDIANIKVKAAM